MPRLMLLLKLEAENEGSAETSDTLNPNANSNANPNAHESPKDKGSNVHHIDTSTHRHKKQLRYMAVDWISATQHTTDTGNVHRSR